MSAAATFASRDPFKPRSAQRNGPALGLALVAHALLIAALAFGVNWHDSEPTTVAAELWSATPQAAAPRAVEPPPPPPQPTPAEVKKPEPVVAPPKPQAPALPDPQIAIEKAKREEAKRQQAEDDAREKQKQAEKAQREKEDLAKKKAAADKLAKEKADKADAEKTDKLAKEKAEKADAAKQAAIRDANLKRMQGLAGATGGANDTGSALHSSAPSASYGGRVAARIKPNIVFTDAIDGNPRAVVEVKLAPDGTIAAKRLVQSSGSKAWDDAVLRAVERTGILPLDGGRVPAPFEIGFRPLD